MTAHPHFELDTDSGKLTRGGRVVQLSKGRQRKVMAFLLDHQDGGVSYADLAREIFGAKLAYEKLQTVRNVVVKIKATFKATFKDVFTDEESEAVWAELLWWRDDKMHLVCTRPGGSLPASLMELVEKAKPPSVLARVGDHAFDLAWRLIARKMFDRQRKFDEVPRPGTCLGRDHSIDEVTVKWGKPWADGSTQVWPAEGGPLDWMREARGPQRLAVFGRPGAGKSAWLANLAGDILEAGCGIPVWVPWRKLKGRSLAAYLHEDWLKAALHGEPAHRREEFDSLLAAGHAWLLLDGVDEPGDGVDVLGDLCDQLMKMPDTRTVATFRSSAVGGAVGGALPGFNAAIELMPFDDAQVSDFVERWMGAAGQPDKAKSLEAQIMGDGRSEWLRTPLLLAVACDVFLTAEEALLPMTRADLYESFFRETFMWKHVQRGPAESDWSALADAIGAIAREAVDAGLSRWPESNMRALPHEGLRRAVDWGWLDKRVDATRTPNYGFTQGTFQEYFAARSIKEWTFFMPEGGPYRIFQPAWQEVILLWLGRTAVATADRNAFIEALATLDEGLVEANPSSAMMPDFAVHAFFLAAAGLKDFPGAEIGDKIVDRLLSWGNRPRGPVAERMLALTDQAHVTRALEPDLAAGTDVVRAYEAARLLARLSKSPAAIDRLEALLEELFDDEGKRIALAAHLESPDVRVWPSMFDAQLLAGEAEGWLPMPQLPGGGPFVNPHYGRSPAEIPSGSKRDVLPVLIRHVIAARPDSEAAATAMYRILSGRWRDCDKLQAMLTAVDGIKNANAAALATLGEVLLDDDGPSNVLESLGFVTYLGGHVDLFPGPEGNHEAAPAGLSAAVAQFRAAETRPRLAKDKSALRRYVLLVRTVLRMSLANAKRSLHTLMGVASGFPPARQAEFQALASVDWDWDRLYVASERSYAALRQAPGSPAGKDALAEPDADYRECDGDAAPELDPPGRFEAFLEARGTFGLPEITMKDLTPWARFSLLPYEVFRFDIHLRPHRAEVPAEVIALISGAARAIAGGGGTQTPEAAMARVQSYLGVRHQTPARLRRLQEAAQSAISQDPEAVVRLFLPWLALPADDVLAFFGPIIAAVEQSSTDPAVIALCQNTPRIVHALCGLSEVERNSILDLARTPHPQGPEATWYCVGQYLRHFIDRAQPTLQPANAKASTEPPGEATAPRALE